MEPEKQECRGERTDGTWTGDCDCEECFAWQEATWTAIETATTFPDY